MLRIEVKYSALYKIFDKINTFFNLVKKILKDDNFY